MQNPDEMLTEDMGRFYADPLGFVMYVFPWNTNEAIQQIELPEDLQKKYGCKHGPDKWARDFLNRLGEEVKKRQAANFEMPSIKFSTASGHGIGKSALTSWLVLWIMSTRPGCNGVVTANTVEQLRGKTWAELSKWWKLSINSHWFDYAAGRGNMSIRAKEDPQGWKCLAQTCREENSESFAGLHAASSTPFYIFDEASAVPDKIFEVREGGNTDGEAMMFDFGNPTRNTGRFFENCEGRFAHRYIVTYVDSREAAIPNKSVFEEWIEDYGVDSDFVKVRVRGMFPSVGAKQFIPGDEARLAMLRELPEYNAGALVLGVDVARFGDDASVIYPRIGRDARSWEPRLYRGLDSIQLAGKVIEYVREFQQLGRTVRAIFVDGGGLGGGVVDQLRHLGYKPIEVLAQHKCIQPEHYRYRTDEMWGGIKEAIRNGLCLPNFQSAMGSQLYAELTQREYDYTLKGQVSLESKSDMKNRGIDSPNVADALALTYYMEVGLEKRPDDGYNVQHVVSDYDPISDEWFRK